MERSSKHSSTVVSSLPQRLNRLLTIDFRWFVLAFRVLAWWIIAFAVLIGGFFLLSALKPTIAAIPFGIQVACLILIALAFTLLLLMLRERRRMLDASDYFLKAFEQVKPASPEERTYGLAPDKMNELRRKGNALRGKPRDWWLALEESLERYSSADGTQGWFLTRPVAECLPEDDVISGFYHASFYQVVPNILTALGLLATFIAILVALAGVTYQAQDPAHPVTGIDQLINGLAGKFLSSIVALVLSVAFVFFEKKICERQIYRAYDRLVKRCKEIFPFLSQSRILLDIQRAVNRSGLLTQAEIDKLALGG